METHAETTITSETVYSGKIFSVTRDTVRLPGGGRAQRDVLHHGGGAGIVALNAKGEVAMVRQYRYGVQRELLEIPAGKIDAGEAPRDTALRELREEVGCEAGILIDFGHILPTPAYCSEVTWLFAAADLTPAKQSLDEDEFLTVQWLPLAEVAGMALRGEVSDAKTVAGILRAAAMLEKDPNWPR